jgi:photosystem II stability/assembly factor-like uncharacterized protein
MKKIILSFIIIPFTLVIANAQSGWVEYPTGVNRTIKDIYFVNANTGWAVGDSTILKSTNSGLNWIIFIN